MYIIYTQRWIEIFESAQVSQENGSLKRRKQNNVSSISKTESSIQKLSFQLQR